LLKVFPSLLTQSGGLAPVEGVAEKP